LALDKSYKLNSTFLKDFVNTSKRGTSVFKHVRDLMTRKKTEDDNATGDLSGIEITGTVKNSDVCVFTELLVPALWN